MPKKTSKAHIKKSQEPDDVAAPPVEARLSARNNSLVFVSHDSRDADLAEAFANLLTDVSGGMLKSFRASDKKGTAGIPFGAEWYRSIMSQLGESTDVVALLTPQSIERPWILYEAGVAKGKLDITVLGVALGTTLETVSAGPFGQFQNCEGDEDSLTKLVIQLLQRNPDAAPRDEAVRMQVKIFCAKAAEILEKRGKKNLPARTEDDKSVAKLFEEVKAMVRDLPERVDDRVLSSARPRLKGRRIHPGMLEELVMGPRFSRRDDYGATGLLVLISILREDAPWLYEPGMELYRALRSGNSTSISRAQRQLMAVAEITHHPMFFEFQRGGDEDAFMLFREMPMLIDRVVSRARKLRSHAPSKSSSKEINTD